MSKTVNYILLTVIALLIAGIVIYTCQEKKEKTVIETELSQVEETDTVSYEAPPTIQDFLEFREMTKEAIAIDSIFLNMPDIILVNILMNHGTDLSNTEIVDIYLNNKEIYDNDVIGGAKAKQYIDSLKLGSTTNNDENLID